MLKISVLLCLLPLLATAKSSFFGSANQVPLSSNPSVPGKNPLFYCQSPDDYTLKIKNVDLVPNPPQPGHKLVIEASGSFTDEVEKGAYINLSVKYGVITLVRTKADLCEQMEEVDKDCPLKGDQEIRKEVDIPKEIPPGTYTVLADVYSKDNKRITCLEATTHFGL